MQILFNIAYLVISFALSIVDFSPPLWFAELVIGIVKYGGYAAYFLPLGTFFAVAFFVSGFHLVLMLFSLLLKTIP